MHLFVHDDIWNILGHVPGSLELSRKSINDGIRLPSSVLFAKQCIVCAKRVMLNLN